MNEIGLDLTESLPLDDDGVGLVLLRGHEGAEPGAFRQLGGRLRGCHWGRLLGDWKKKKIGVNSMVLDKGFFF